MSLVINDCGNNVQDLLHLLAASVVKDASNVKYLRLKLTVHTCEEIDPAVDCTNSHVSAEELLKEVVLTDDCGETLILNISIPEIPS